MNRHLKFLLWIVVFAIILYAGAFYQIELVEYQRSNYRMVPLMTFVSLFPLLIGMLLRIPGLLTETKQWGMDWGKMLILGIPLLYLSLYPLFFSLGLPVTFVFLTNLILGTHNVTTTIAGVVCGYILLDSLKKKR